MSGRNHSDGGGGRDADMTGYVAQQQHQQQQQRRRNRIRFSCNNCRNKKLKCNRVLPCDQCQKRSLGAVCRYVPYTSYQTSGSGSTSTRGEQPSLKRQHSMVDQAFDEFERDFETSSIASSSRGGSVMHESQQQHHQQNSMCHNQQPYPDNPYQRHHQKPTSHHLQRQQNHDVIPRSAQPFHIQPPAPIHDPSSQSVPERLKYLEHLVLFLRARSADVPYNQQLSPGSQSIQNKDIDIEVDGDEDDAETMSAGRVVSDAVDIDMDVAEFRYADPSNWEGVLDDIVGLTRDLVLIDDSVLQSAGRWDFGPQLASNAANCLALLQASSHGGSTPPTSISDMLRYLPPRPVVDLLVRRFFLVAAEPVSLRIMFHPPSFHRRYDVFWNEPRAASFSYLALLFMITAHAALYCVRADEPVPGGLGDDPLSVIDACRHRAAQCLVLDDYSRPGRYKVEAMVLYFGVEYFWRRRLAADNTSNHHSSHSPLSSTAIILSIAVRLAMHMGYHRDPTHFGGRLSPFEGEMCRRTWAVLVDLDKTMCFEFGLPTNVNHGSSSSSSSRYSDSDTQPPRNLYDSDIYEDMPTLPPARPETERTSTLYAIARARLMAVLADIMQLKIQPLTPSTTTAAGSGGSVSPLPTPPTSTAAGSRTGYNKRVMHLDRRLTAAYNSLPDGLRLRSPEIGALGSSSESSSDGPGPSTMSSDTSSGRGNHNRNSTHASNARDRDPLDPCDPVDLCIQRYLLEILYQKARLVLHRRFQGVDRATRQYAYSRWVCTDAAVRMLRHQYDLYMAMQPPTAVAGGESEARKEKEEASGERKENEVKKETGGRLSEHRWLLSDSAVSHDLLLANTVLCLEVSYVTRRPTGIDGEPGSSTDGNGAVVSLPQLLGLLRTSRSIWATLRGTSSEAERAYKVLTRVLADAEAIDEQPEPTAATAGPASPAATTSTSRTTVSGMTSISAMTSATTATTVSMLSTPATTATTTTTATASTPESADPDSGTSGSTTPRYGEYKPDPLVAVAAATSLPVAQGMVLPQLPTAATTLPWPGPSGPLNMPPTGDMAPASLLPVMLDMPPPVVSYGMSEQTATGATTGNYTVVPGNVTGDMSSMQPSMPPAMSVPMQFTTTGNSGSLPNIMDNGMEGIADPTYASYWNLWQDQQQRRADTMPPSWNDFFAPGGGIDNP